jgi:hypothetical protein
LAVLGAASASGCIAFEKPQYECTGDKDCSGKCSDVGVCIAAGQSMAVRLAWTVPPVAGETPAIKANDPCTEVEIYFSGEVSGASAFRLNCAGEHYFRSIPRYEQVRVTAYGSTGEEIGRAEATLDSAKPLNDLQLELRP